MKELKQTLFQELRSVYQTILVSLLEELDVWLRDYRDFSHFKNREMQECTIGRGWSSFRK